MTLDRYTRAVLQIIRRRYAEWDESPPTAADIQRPGEQTAVKTFATVGGVQVPVFDEDWPTRTFAEKALHALFRSPLYGLSDFDQPWESPEAAVKEIEETFGPRLIPPENGHWDEMHSDDAQSRFAFSGLASLPLERTDHGFKVDMGWMKDLTVRKGFERYGATAWFDQQRQITAIDWGHGDKRVTPGDPDWDHAKFAWRSSVFVGTTLSEHLWGLHLRIGNTVVCAAREHLPAEHPLRLLLKAFTFRTVAINHRAAAVLVVERGLPHRAFALDYKGLAAGLTARPIHLRPFPEQLRRRGTLELEDFPYGEDGKDLYQTIEDHVSRWINLYWPGQRDLEQDGAIDGFWRTLADILPEDESWRQAGFRRVFTRTIAAFIFSVVGQHKHVGALREYLLNPSFVGSRIRPGSECVDQQASALTMLLVAGTGLAQPMLLSDFSHLLPEEHADEAKLLHDRFQNELRTLAAKIEFRNDRRGQPYHCMNPKRLECSVSI